MTRAARAPAPGRGASLAAIAVGAATAGFGFLAATASGMATAPDRDTGFFSMAVMTAGSMLFGLGIASFFSARLRPAARAGAILLAVALLALYIVGQVLIMTGLSDG